MTFSTLERALAESLLSSLRAMISMSLPLDRVFDSLRGASGRCRPKSADENRHLPAFGKQLDDLLAQNLARFVVVGADVEQAIGSWGHRNRA